ncbi:hypothetical protein [Pseudonocardia parietis]|uniref:Uncharacterized protein n=1 Tax=Pseudonocardia parietis TaxID=570936 RepID=A0ABS4VXV1_9PSEU|nr:hypothetical protein [Pseudonocardia parietis]MBP2368734.1 hypothetical protein [Pseudonocardia parietis]
MTTTGPVGHPDPFSVRGLREVGPLPGTRQEWVTAAARVSGVLLALRAAEAAGLAAPPPPLDGGRTLRAWARVVRPVLDRTEHVTVPIGLGDLHVLAAAAAALGTALCRVRSGGGPDPVVDVLRADAAAQQATAGQLVMQLARVHGTLTAGAPGTAGQIWQAGALSPVDDEE